MSAGYRWSANHCILPTQRALHTHQKFPNHRGKITNGSDSNASTAWAMKIRWLYSVVGDYWLLNGCRCPTNTKAINCWPYACTAPLNTPSQYVERRRQLVVSYRFGHYRPIHRQAKQKCFTSLIVKMVQCWRLNFVLAVVTLKVKDSVCWRLLSTMVKLILSHCHLLAQQPMRHKRPTVQFVYSNARPRCRCDVHWAMRCDRHARRFVGLEAKVMPSLQERIQMDSLPFGIWIMYELLTCGR